MWAFLAHSRASRGRICLCPPPPQPRIGLWLVSLFGGSWQPPLHPPPPRKSWVRPCISTYQHKHTLGGVYRRLSLLTQCRGVRAVDMHDTFAVVSKSNPSVDAEGCQLWLSITLHNIPRIINTKEAGGRYLGYIEHGLIPQNMGARSFVNISRKIICWYLV